MPGYNGNAESQTGLGRYALWTAAGVIAFGGGYLANQASRSSADQETNPDTRRVDATLDVRDILPTATPSSEIAVLDIRDILPPTAVIAAVTPEATATPEPVPTMPAEMDTPLGLNSSVVDQEFNQARDFAAFLLRMDDASPEAREENFLYRAFRAHFVPNEDRMTARQPEELGLGHTEISAFDYSRAQRFFDDLITPDSLEASKSTSEIKTYIFKSNPLENTTGTTVYKTEGRLATSYLYTNGYDNLDSAGVQQIVDGTKIVTLSNGDRFFDTLTEEEKLYIVDQVWQGWDAQREEYPLGTPVQRPIRYNDENGYITELLTTNTAGEQGILVRRIQRTEDAEALTSQCVVVVEQENGIHTETPKNELSRLGHWASVVTIDIASMNESVRSANSKQAQIAAYVEGMVNSMAAYERMDLDTAYAVDMPEEKDEGDMTHFTRPGCAPAPKPVETPVPVQPEVVPTQPPVVETPQETPTPEHTPTPEPPKSGKGETNPKGTTPDQMPTQAPPDDTSEEEANQSPL